MRADHDVFSDPARWHDLPADALIEAAVRELAAIFGRHRDFLRAAILVSGVHPEVYRRGSAYSRELGERFAGVLQPLRHRIGPPGTDADTALQACFTTVFSALVLRVAYGPGFAAEAVDDVTHTAQLARMSASYLLSR